AERFTAPSWRLSDATDLAGAGNRQVKHRGANQFSPGDLGEHCRGNRAIAADGEPARGSGPPPCRSPSESPGRHSLGTGRGRGSRSAEPMSLRIARYPFPSDSHLIRWNYSQFGSAESRARYMSEPLGVRIHLSVTPSPAELEQARERLTRESCPRRYRWYWH